MKWKGRRQSKNIEYDEEYGKNYGPHVEYYNETNSQKAIHERKKRDALRGTIPMTEIKGKISKKDFKAAKELVKIHDEGKTPIPTPKPTKTQVTPGKWNTK